MFREILARAFPRHGFVPTLASRRFRPSLARFQDKHRSHFGSRYTLGCCDLAGLFFVLPHVLSSRVLPHPAHRVAVLRVREGGRGERGEKLLTVPHPIANRPLCRLTPAIERRAVHSQSKRRQRILLQSMVLAEYCTLKQAEGWMSEVNMRSLR